MFGFGRRDEKKQQHGKQAATTPRQRKHGRHNKHMKQKQVSAEKEEEEEDPQSPMSMESTDLGIEVSFDSQTSSTAAACVEDAASRSSPTTTHPATTTAAAFATSTLCVRFLDQMRRRQKVYRTQFSVNFPLLPNQQHDDDHDNEPTSSGRRHRVPLFPKKSVHSPHEDYDDELLLLQSHHCTTEEQAVKDELSRILAEMEALEEDRMDLEQKFLKLPSQHHTASNPTTWSVYYRLRTDKTLSDTDRKTLEQKRGVCFTFSLHNEGLKEAFSSICGSRVNTDKNKNEYITLSPDNCIHGGAAQSAGHVALLSGTNQTGGVFVGRDENKALYYGHVPRRLYQQMKRRNLDIARDLVYLSTGPHGCYYAEFRGGECLWGNALQQDADFQKIVREWDVYRVAFGPIQTFQDDDGHAWTTSSWIILNHDGRAAWKNVPSRLHRTLESRLADWAAPAEVSLGSDGAYFIRFLDGSIDYCLPAGIANVCESIVARGGSITDIKLHPDVSQDYIIRHTVLK